LTYRLYERPGLLDRIGVGLQKEGKSLATVTLDDLAAVDEFHLRGPAATNALIEMLDVKVGASVLDAGCGLGGPARRLAQSKGCNVTGVDLSREFCTVGNQLTAAVGLDTLVELHVGNVTDLTRFNDNAFDAAWTVHVGMNIADKAAFYGEIWRVLKPGAPFLIYDVLAGSDLQNLIFPLPWAADQSSSFLISKNDLTECLTLAGFNITHIHDWTTTALAFITAGVAKIQINGQSPLGLHLVLGPIAKEALPNISKNLEDGRLHVSVFECEKAT